MATTLADATALVLANAELLPSETVALGAAAGRVLAEEVAAAHDMPQLDNSAMDGFALASADCAPATASVPVRLRVALESRAGAPADRPLRPGEAARISTGGVMPDGADCVLRVEDAHLEGDELLVASPIEPGNDVRPAGDDLRAGTRVLSAGDRIGAGEIAMLASCGRTQAQVARRARVAIVGTGDELVAPGEELGPGMHFDSNTPMLAALAAGCGAEVTRVHSRVGDSLESTVAALEDAIAAAEVVLISGGVSVGPHDHVKPALERLGVRELFWRVALRPGHPAWFGRSGGTVVFGLPGNPASSYVVFQLLARPALAALHGDRRPPLELLAVYRGPTQRKRVGPVAALRCSLATEAGRPVARPAGSGQASHLLTSLVGVDGLALLGPEVETLQDGDETLVRVL